MPPTPDVILERIRRVPPGYVTTYGDVAPGSPRLVARILSRGAPADVPWWRVVRSDGTCAVGAEQRARLLEEDVPFRRDRVDLAEARIPLEAIH